MAAAVTEKGNRISELSTYLIKKEYYQMKTPAQQFRDQVEN